MTDDELTESLVPRSVHGQRNSGHTIAGLRVGTVMFGGCLQSQERVTRKAISRSAAEVADGGLPTCEDVLSRYREDERKKAGKKEKRQCAEARAGRRAASDAATQQEGRAKRKRSRARPWKESRPIGTRCASHNRWWRGRLLFLRAAAARNRESGPCRRKEGVWFPSLQGRRKRAGERGEDKEVIRMCLEGVKIDQDAVRPHKWWPRRRWCRFHAQEPLVTERGGRPCRQRVVCVRL